MARIVASGSVATGHDDKVRHRRPSPRVWKNVRSVTIKRAYEPAVRSDGSRILVDRLWPRGISKRKAALDGWMKEVAPSAALRKWFGHKPERFKDFAKRYRAELKGNPALEDLRALKGKVTLVYGAKDPKINHAAVLAKVLKRKA
jgi:uncharacterized protein YeaO (DUF488 family)